MITFVTKVCKVVMGWVDFVESSVFHPEYEYLVQFYQCYLTSPEGVIVLVAHAAEEPLPLRHLLQRPHPGSVQQVPVLVQDISLQLLVTIIITNFISPSSL